MFVRLLGKLLVKRMNIPLRRSAFATRRCPPFEGGCWLCVGNTVSFIGQRAFGDIETHDATSQDHPL